MTGHNLLRLACQELPRAQMRLSELGSMAGAPPGGKKGR